MYFETLLGEKPKNSTYQRNVVGLFEGLDFCKTLQFKSWFSNQMNSSWMDSWDYYIAKEGTRLSQVHTAVNINMVS